MEHILKSIYSRKNWVELVHDIFGNSYKVLKNPLVEKADNHIAVAALCLGKIELSDGNVIAVYETQLQPNIQLSRNKVGIRNLLRNSWKLYDGALIGSYIEGSDEWRFSYISETKGFDAEGNYGNLKTQPKRFTYLFGKQHPCRTAKQRFGDLMNSEKTLENIKDAFSVEALSDEFFKDYKQQYEKFCTFVYLHKTNTDFFGKEFAAYDDKTVRDYVKKMLGRIVFLNFLQKKGWLGVPAQNKDWTGGDLNFMRSLYVNANDYQRDKFLDLVLEPLFFNCLNEKRAADLFDTKIERIGKVKIPYLNSGLFEKDAIDKPDSNFPADYFANLFDLFSQYNFTIDENDPNDAEVGVDPEMLGKIFENLLEDNKDKGAFYTPKEIVQYMCRESLIAYLESQNNHEDYKKYVRPLVEEHCVTNLPIRWVNVMHAALYNVKICDPAIGSGAFPMGLLNELFACRMALNDKDGVHTVSTDNAAKIKREIIQNNIYGVDIEKGAVDIARLRFWLALVVDETEPQPLPNLDYKIMQGNSLLESYEGVDLSNIMQSDDMFVNKAAEGLGSKLEEYYNEDNHTTKAKLRAEIDNIVKNSIKAANPQVGDIEIPNDKFFLWHTYFADVFNPATDCNASGGFDIVIGNPPYGAKIPENEKKTLKQTYQTAKTISGVQKGSMDSYTLFIERGINLLCKNGNLTYIVPISFTSSDSLTGVHRLLESNCNTIRVSSYAVRPQPVFKNAVVDTSIIAFTKTLTPCQRLFSTKMHRKGRGFSLQNLIDNLQFAEVKNLKLYGRIPKISQPIEINILKKILTQKPIREFVKNDGLPIYYRTTGGRYFKVVTDYSTGSTKENPIPFECELASVIGCMLSSNLSFWFYQIYSNNLDWKGYEIESFTIPYSNITKETTAEINALYKEYLVDIERNANVRISSGNSSYNVASFKEYKIGKSKAIIDRIDDLICPLYGLTKEETEFVKHYEIEFRLGGEG